MTDNLHILYRWGCMSEAEYLRRANPCPKYTYEDCIDYDPSELGF